MKSVNMPLRRPVSYARGETGEPWENLQKQAWTRKQYACMVLGCGTGIHSQSHNPFPGTTQNVSLGVVFLF